MTSGSGIIISSSSSGGQACLQNDACVTCTNTEFLLQYCTNKQSVTNSWSLWCRNVWGLGGIAGTTSAAGSTRTSSSRQVRLLLSPTKRTSHKNCPKKISHKQKKNLLRVRTKGNETNKKRGEETFACCCWQRRRKKNGLIRDVEFVRPIYSMIYPFQLFGAFLLVR